MKEFYEQIPKTKLMRRCPVILRVDGKSFHTFTKNFQKPFDMVLVKTMQDTMKYMCENIQGCILGYTQSDEITLVLTDYKELNSSAWYDYEVQKMCSVTASMATMRFNKMFVTNYLDYLSALHPDFDNKSDMENWRKLSIAYEKASESAIFDCRCFNIPKEEVANLIYWRQLDAMRNSVQMIGNYYFSQKELEHVNTDKLKEILKEQKGIDWNSYPVEVQRGSCCIKDDCFEPSENGKYGKFAEGVFHDGEPIPVVRGTWRRRWKVDTNIPIFKGDDRNYINKLVYIEEEEKL